MTALMTRRIIGLLTITALLTGPYGLAALTHGAFHAPHAGPCTSGTPDRVIDCAGGCSDPAHEHPVSSGHAPPRCPLCALSATQPAGPVPGPPTIHSGTAEIVHTSDDSRRVIVESALRPGIRAPPVSPLFA